MSYETLIAAICEIIDRHNTALGEANEGKVDKEAFLAELRRTGGATTEALKEASWEDLRACGLPQLLAKQVAGAIRSHTTEASTPVTRRITANYAADATEEELVLAYDPEKPTSPAALELKARSKERPFVVFDPSNGGVHRKATLALLNELKDGHPPRETYPVGTLPQKVYRVGERPPRMADEHPLLPGEPLRPDGTDRYGLQWNAPGLTLVKRQLARLACGSGELQVVNSVDGFSEVHERLCKLDEDALHQRYPRASQRFQELRDASQLPTLRVPLGVQGGGRGNNPFHSASSHVTT